MSKEEVSVPAVEDRSDARGRSQEAPPKGRFWVSWFAADSPFTLESPWWISGARLFGDGREQATVCAAVEADDEDDARWVIERAHDKRVSLEWRFVERKADNWSPYSERFPAAGWMVWPDASMPL